MPEFRHALTVGMMFVLLMIATSGCRRASNGRIPVTGTVRFDSNPLPNGTVGFIGEEGYVVALGLIKNGSYELFESNSQKGILPGNYRVRVESWLEEPGMIRPDGSMSPGKPAIPAKYFKDKTSGFSANVSEENHVFDLLLTSK